MGRRRDAALALVVALPVFVAILILDAPIRLESVALGALGAFLLEGVLLLDRDRVRSLWNLPAVQVAAVVGGAILVGLGVVLVGTDVLVVALSGLVTYLGLLGAVSLRARRD